MPKLKELKGDKFEGMSCLKISLFSGLLYETELLVKFRSSKFDLLSLFCSLSGSVSPVFFDLKLSPIGKKLGLFPIIVSSDNLKLAFLINGGVFLMTTFDFLLGDNPCFSYFFSVIKILQHSGIFNLLFLA